MSTSMIRRSSRLAAPSLAGAILLAAQAAGAAAPDTSSAIAATGAVTPVTSCLARAPGAPAVPPADDSSFASVPLDPKPADGPIGTWPGTWTPMPPAPIAARAGAATDGTPDGVMAIWSGRGADGGLLWDGALFDAVTETWTVIGGSPPAPRTDFAFVVNRLGTMFLWGGVGEDGSQLGDGAYWMSPLDGLAPPGGTWMRTFDAPLEPGPAAASGDVLNAVSVVAPGTSLGEEPTFAVAGSEGWDPKSIASRSGGGTAMPGSWPDPERQPATPTGIGYEVISPWNRGDTLFLSILGHGAALATRLDLPGSRRWSTPVRVPMPADAGCPARDRPWSPWTGWIGTDGTGTPMGILAPSGEGAWRQTATPPREAMTGGMLVWAPRRLIVADALLAYDITAERWLRLPALPDGPRTGVSAAWENGDLFLWGGRTADGSVSDTGWRFTPTVPAGTFRLDALLPGDDRRAAWDCGIPIGHWTLRADPQDPARVWMENETGRRLATVWTDGDVVRFDPGGAVVLDPDGAVVAREGDSLDAIAHHCASGAAVGFGPR